MLWLSKWCFLLLSLSGMLHPARFAVTSLEYNSSDNEMLILFKFHIEDLKLAIFHNYNYEFKNEDFYNDSINYENINDYFNRHFMINNKTIENFTFVGSEFEGNNLWFKYTFQVENSWKKIHIENTFFTDLYYDQTNLVIIKFDDFEKGYELNYEDYIIDIDLKTQ